LQTSKQQKKSISLPLQRRGTVALSYTAVNGIKKPKQYPEIFTLMKSGMYKDAARSRCLKGAITQVLALTIQSRPGITWGKSSKVGGQNGNRKQHIPVAVLAGNVTDKFIHVQHNFTYGIISALCTMVL